MSRLACPFAEGRPHVDATGTVPDRGLARPSPPAVPAQGQDDLAKAPPPTGLLAPEAATTVAARLALLEGPAFDGAGNLFFSDIYGNRIYRMTPDGTVSVFRADSGRTNGNTFDARGRLISCEGAEQDPAGAAASSAPTWRRAGSRS